MIFKILVLRSAFRKFVLAFVMLTQVSVPSAFAEDSSQDLPKFDPLEQVKPILGGGAAGAILGLSTLSFYPDWEKRLNHITIGAACGIILTAALMTFVKIKDAHPESIDDRYEEKEIEKILKGSSNVTEPQPFMMTFSVDF